MREHGRILATIVGLAKAHLDFADGVSVSLQRSGRYETTNALPDSLAEVDKVQYEHAEGPCVRATETGAVVAVVLGAERGRWPDFVTAASAAGFQSVLSTPLTATRSAPVGALNIYSRRTDPFTDADVEEAGAFAEHASTLLANAAASASTEAENRNLRIALETRERIGEAKGVLMSRLGLTGDEAFDQLRRTSQRSNRKLRDIAQEVIDTTRRARPDDG